MTTAENNVAAQAGDKPLTERDIADLRNVIAVAERGRMPDLAAQAQAMLDSGVLPARAAGKTVQAGVEPMRAAFEAHYGPRTGFSWRNADGTYKVGILQDAWEIWQKAVAYAAQVSPRATADVEREGGALHYALIRCCKELSEGYLVRVEVERGAGWVEWFGPENLTTGNVIDGEGHLSDDVEQALAAIATTKPGA